MKEFKNIHDILDFAINAEQESVDFYKGLAGRAKNQAMKMVFEEFAAEEIAHKAKLVGIKEKGIIEIKPEKVADLKIADFVVSSKPNSDMTYQDAIVIAMKKEKAAFKLYSALSERAPDKDMKDLFASLAIEEAKHKLRFELEYDEFVLREN